MVVRKGKSEKGRTRAASVERTQEMASGKHVVEKQSPIASLRNEKFK